MSWTKSIIPIKQLPSGEELSITIHTLSGKKQGPHIHIQSSVHGAELQGNAVILKLMEYLKGKDIAGTISFVPLANPVATNNKHGTYTYGRYNPITGHNWNRNYIDIIQESKFELKAYCKKHFDTPWEDLKKGYKLIIQELVNDLLEKKKQTRNLHDNNKLNLILQNLAAKADGILDLHTGPTATRYLYVAEYEEEIAQYLLFRNNLVIPNEFDGAMDEASFMPWIWLKNTFLELGREIELDIESFTLEFGSEETFCMDSANNDVESILNYLRYKKVLKEDPSRLNPSEIYYSKLENYMTIYSPKGGLVDYKVAPGDHIVKNDVIAQLYQFKDLDPNNPILSTMHTIKAQNSGIIINRCPSSSVSEGMELFQIMSHTYQK